MPIRQKVRPLLLLKKQLGHFQRVGTNTLAIGNRLQGIGTGPGQTGLRALSLQANVGSDDVTVNFNEDVVVTDPASGVSITVNGNAATFTAIKGPKTMVYTLTSQNPVDYDDLVVWTYSAAAAGADPYTGQDSGEVLSDSSLARQMSSAPPAAPTWGTVFLPVISVGEGWSVNLNDYITDDGGQTPTFSIASGGLPPGISLVSNGTFSGVATAGGAGSVTFTATNNGGSANSNAAGWTVISVVTWSTVTLPTISEGEGWSTDLNSFITDDGGEQPTFSIASGVLPDGITLNANGTFSGVASDTSAGSDFVSFRATNRAGPADSNLASWEVSNVALPPVTPIAGWTGLENCA